jgi:hypothetical protein
MNTKISLLFLFLILATSLRCDILTSTAHVGEELEILVEQTTKYNDSAIAISPSAKQIQVQLENGQGKIRVEEAGLWRIEYNDEGVEVLILPKKSQLNSSEINQKKDAEFLWIGAILIIIFFVIVVIATIIVFSKIFSQAYKKPSFTKECKNKTCTINFDSGALPLEDVEIFLNSKKVAGTKKMQELERLQIRVEENLATGKCFVIYHEKSKKCKIDIVDKVKTDENCISKKICNVDDKQIFADKIQQDKNNIKTRKLSKI